MRTLTCSPNSEVIGATVRSLIVNLTAAEYTPLVEQYGYNNVDPDRWYPLQDYLNFLTDLSQQPNLMFNLVSIGMSIADVAPMPPELVEGSLAQMVEGWDHHYQSSVRNGDVGYKTAIQVTPQHYKVVHNKTVMPDDLEYGVLYGFARRFLPPGTDFFVWYDEDVPRMDEGGDQTILHVSWE